MEGVAERLREWSFEDLIKVFEDNGIDDEAFNLLDTDTIKDLIPAVGPRVKFLKAFKAFRQAELKVADKDVEAARERPDRHVAPEGLQEIEDDEVTPMSTSEDDEPLERMMPPKKPMQCKFDIHGILSKIPNGSQFLEKLEGKRTANYHDRKVICHALVGHLMKHHGTNPPGFIKECLAESLVEKLAFLKDKEGITGYEAWYIKGKKGRPASGCLEERLRYIRRKEQTPPTNPKKKVQPPKKSSPTTCPKLLQKCHQPTEAVLSYEEEEELINVLKHTQNTGDIIALMGRTAKNRHAWIRTSKSNVVEILARYPHLLQPKIIEQDFELTISQEASKRLLITWPRMSQQILQYVKNVEAPKNWEEKLGLTAEIKDLSEGEQQGLALNVLPFLFSGRSKTMRGKCTPEQALNSFIDWKAEGTSVEFYCTSVVNKEHPQSQPFVLLIGGNRWSPLQAFAVVEHRAVACPSVVAAVDLVFKMIFVLDVDYQPHCMAVWQFLEGLVYKLGGSVTVASILRFRNWLSQQ